LSGAAWIGRQLFLGRTIIGAVQPSNEAGAWLGMSYLPGAAILIGRDFPSEVAAQERVLQSAQSRCKAMFGAGIGTTESVVHDGRALRVIARAIWRAGVWRCDRPVNAHAMFADLGEALGFKPEDAPLISEGRDQGSGSSAEPTHDDGEFLEDIERERA